MVFMGGAVELLAKTGLANGLTVSGPEASQAVMTEAGAKWDDEALCISGPLMTGECTDIPAFITAMIAHIADQPAVEVKAAA